MKTRTKFIAGSGISAGALSVVFLLAFGDTMLVEGGYSNNPYDLGGQTMFGVTEAVARASGYTGLMWEMPIETAQEIASTKYWRPMMLDNVAEMDDKLAMKLFDVGYNVGIYRAGRWFQRCLNVLNNKGAHYGDIYIDGRIGAQTISAFESYMARRDDAQTIGECIAGLQVAHYVSISESRIQNEEFTYGWIRRVD